MKKKQTRKEKLTQRANRYLDNNASFDCGLGWEDGYKSALRDVRRAAGKCGLPSAVMKLLAPMR